MLTRCGLPCPSISWRMRSTAHVWQTSVPADHCAWARALASRLHRGGHCAALTQSYGCFNARPSSRSRRTESKGSSPMLRQHDQEQRTLFLECAWATACARAQQAPEETRGHHLPVRKACAPSSIPCCTGHGSQELAGVALGQRLRHFVDTVTIRRGGQWRAGTALGAGQEGRFGMRCWQTRRCP